MKPTEIPLYNEPSATARGTTPTPGATAMAVPTRGTSSDTKPTFATLRNLPILS